MGKSFAGLNLMVAALKDSGKVLTLSLALALALTLTLALALTLTLTLALTPEPHETTMARPPSVLSSGLR